MDKNPESDDDGAGERNKEGVDIEISSFDPTDYRKTILRMIFKILMKLCPTSVL